MGHRIPAGSVDRDWTICLLKQGMPAAGWPKTDPRWCEVTASKWKPAATIVAGQVEDAAPSDGQTAELAVLLSSLSDSDEGDEGSDDMEGNTPDMNCVCQRLHCDEQCPVGQLV